MGPEWKLKQAVFEMFKQRSEGDMLMDAPEAESWRQLLKYVSDRNYCHTRVRSMMQPRVWVEMGPHLEEGGWAPFTISH